MRSINLCGETQPHAGHVCAFFDSREQKYETLIPFLQDAIAAGDSVINIIDEGDKAAHLDTLQREGVPVGRAMGNGTLRMFTSEQTYLQPGLETLPRLLDFLRKELELAKSENHCLRTWGEMNWIERNEVPVSAVLEYEARVNELFPGFECTLLCIYDLAKISAVRMADILMTHPSAIINGRLRRNPHYVEPKEYLHMLRARTA